MNSTRNIMALIEILLADGGDIGVRELAARTGIPKSTVQRFLSSMEENGWVVRDRGTQGFRIGYKLLGQSNGWRLRLELGNKAQDVLADLSAQTGLCATLSCLDGWHGLRIAASVPEALIAETTACPLLFDLHACASGQALLAFAPLPLQKHVLFSGLKAYSAGTLTSSAALGTRLETVRDTQAAQTVGEHYPGCAEIAVPILNPDGSSLAAIAVSGPEKTVAENSAKCLGTLHSAAEELLKKMEDF